MLTHFICDLTGERVEFASCIECAEDPTKPHCHATPAMLHGMCDQIALDERKYAGISVTSLVGCLRRGYYAIATEYGQRPSKLWSAFRGTLFHKMMEKYQPKHYVTEDRFGRYLDGGVLLTGKPDEFRPNEKLLIDYKSKEVVPDQPPQEYVEQLNCYRLLMQDGWSMDTGEHVSLEADRLGIEWLTMNGYQKVPVQVMDLDLVHELFATRALLVNTALQGGALPPRNVSNPMKSTFCVNWCPSLQNCIASSEERKEKEHNG
jgi:hypothetical protein